MLDMLIGCRLVRNETTKRYDAFIRANAVLLIEGSSYTELYLIIMTSGRSKIAAVL